MFDKNLQTTKWDRMRINQDLFDQIKKIKEMEGEKKAKIPSGVKTVKYDENNSTKSK